MLRRYLLASLVMLAAPAWADESPLTMLIICTNEERVEEIICPVVVVNEQVKACECPEGMLQSFTSGSPPRKASGS